MGTASLGKRTIYVATQTLGYEVDGYPQELKPRQLMKGVFNCPEEVDYIEITASENGVISPIKAICLLGRYFMYNPETNVLEEEDIVDEGVETIKAQTTEIIRFEKSAYVKKYAFDCSKVEDLQSSAYQPISGLNIDSTYLTIKTHNFSNAADKPKHQDLLYFQGSFWAIEDTRIKTVYRPKEQSILYMTLKQIKK